MDYQYVINNSNANKCYQQPCVGAYTPIVAHWFYQKVIEDRELWLPLSRTDSHHLETTWTAFVNCGANHSNSQLIVSTDGGRFDVNVYERTRKPIYWSEDNSIVRRCSWFYKREGHNVFAPYDEEFAAKLEDAFRESTVNNRWNERIDFPGQEYVVMHSAQSIYHYQSDLSAPDGWGSMAENPNRPRTVHRGVVPIFNDAIDDGEPARVDHLVFLIHGIGEICDFRFRPIVEVIDDFRSISLSLMRTHYKPYMDSGQLGRIEFLPITWHSSLHGEETGIDQRLQSITLNSIPKLRHFFNDTILDALFYTSPLYCQTIVDNVTSELNRLFALFIQRNPNFCGTVALGGHSLGSVILFDILAHQRNNNSEANFGVKEECDAKSANDVIDVQFNDITDIDTLLQRTALTEYSSLFSKEKVDLSALQLLNESDFERIGLPLGARKKLLCFLQEYYKWLNRDLRDALSQCSPTDDLSRKVSLTSVNYNFESMGIGYPSIVYPRLNFNPSCFFAMGSPIAMFLTVRGVQSINADFRLPTCPSVYNIFHPYDPIAYRIEPMIDGSFGKVKPVLIPHHKGRKRIHLELKESIARMGTDLKQKIFDSLRYTWNSINDFARSHRTRHSGQSSADQCDIDSAVSQMVEDENRNEHQNSGYEESDNSFRDSATFGFDVQSFATQIGSLNSGRRIDYVLQERPFEIFNEYVFAMTSHACYWQSEDTALLILRELYGQMAQLFSAPHLNSYNYINRDTNQLSASEQQYNTVDDSAQQTLSYQRHLNS